MAPDAQDQNHEDGHPPGKAIKRLATLISELVAILNLVVCLVSYASAHSTPVVPMLPVRSRPTRVLLFFIVDYSLAFAIGKPIRALLSRSQLAYYLPAFILMLCSAWISVFNIQWLLLGDPGPLCCFVNQKYVLEFLLWSVVSYSMAMVTIIGPRAEWQRSEVITRAVMQAIAYAILITAVFWPAIVRKLS